MKQIILATILVFGVGLFWISSVQGLTVSPVRFEIMGEPGQTLVGEIELVNEQAIIRTFYSSFENFEARGEGGEPRFVPGEIGLATWIKTDEKVILEPGEKRTVPFTITLPVNAEPGGHFAAIFWGTTPSNPENGGVVVGARIGVLVLLTVTGDIKDGGGILEFRAENKLYTSLPITFFYRFANDGGDRIMPKGEISIRNIIGMKTVILDANPAMGNVLPASIRRFEAQWGNKEEGTNFFNIARHQWENFAFGMYVARLNLSWGQNMVTSASYRFFVIPWQLLSIIIIILIITIFLLVIGIKRYNRWIISRAIKLQNKNE